MIHYLTSLFNPVDQEKINLKKRVELLESKLDSLLVENATYKRKLSVFNYTENKEDCDGWNCRGCSPRYAKDRVEYNLLSNLEGLAKDDLQRVINDSISLEERYRIIREKTWREATEAAAKLCILTPQEYAEGDWGVETSYVSRFFAERIRNSISRMPK